MTDYSALRWERDGRILRIVLDNGPVNAVDGTLHRELAHVFADAEADPESDLVILTGANKAFCAGGDTAWFEKMAADPAGFRRIAPEAKRIVFSILEMEKPILCRLNGAAAGLGATIALLCDVVVADRRAKIGDPHVKMGLVAGDGGAAIWPQLVGFARAKEFLMTGALIDAPRAAEMGLVNHAVPTEELDAKVAEIAGAILANPKMAVRWSKVATNIVLKEIAAKVMDASIGYEMVSASMADHREAVAAFAEKRPPKFTGD